MCSRHHATQSNRIMLTGMAFLVAANIFHRFVQPTVRLSENLLDGGYGLLYGVAIGCLCLSVWRRNRACAPQA
jgi:hypothetical protein